MRNSFKIANKMLLTMGATVIAGGMLAGTQPASAATIKPGPPVSGNESLQEELDNLAGDGNIDAVDDQTGYEVFTTTSTGASAVLAFENSALANDEEFGIYKPGSTDPDDRVTLIDNTLGPTSDIVPGDGLQGFHLAPDGNGNIDVVDDDGNLVNGDPDAENFNSTDFGFFLNQTGTYFDNTFYSEASLNPGGKQQSLIYQGNEHGNTELDVPGLLNNRTFEDTDMIVSFEDSEFIDDNFNDMGVVVSDVEPVPEPSAMAALGLVGSVIALARRRRQ